MNRLTVFGAKAVFQSATCSRGQRVWAARSARLKRAARLRQSGLALSEYFRLNQSTGRPFACVITLSITHAGYHTSGFDSMSLVPSATTIAVVWGVRRAFTVDAPVDAVRPTLASITTLVHTEVERILVASEPKASVPTVNESPTNSRVPWPFGPMRCGAGPAPTRDAGRKAVSTSTTADRVTMVVRRGRGYTTSLWQGGAVIRRHFFTYLALSTLAVAQPLLDLYGKNPTVFSAAKMSNLEVGVFLATVLLAPALVATGLDRVSRWFGPKVNESFRLWMIAGFSFLLGLAVARWLDVDTNVGSVAVAGVTSIVVVRLYDTKKVVRDWSRLLALMSVVVLVSAVVQLRPVLVESNGPSSDAVVANKNVSVFQIIFDEFPLYALLDADGNINAERFPGFAALAGESTWFRNAVAESNFTHQAVPALMASAVPQQSGGPFLAQYPKNIFTLFAGTTAVGGIEPVTSLCPKSVCGGADDSDGVLSLSRLKRFFRDASYVYAQRVLPPVLRSRVPSVEGAWGGFGAVANKFREQFDVGALSQIDAMSQGVEAFVNDSSARVQVTHVLTPHAPWRVTPDLRVAPLSKSIGTSNPETEDGVRDTYQTFLYQLAATDRALAGVVADLKQAGRWDNTMFVVSADHGISFLPTLPQRHTDFTDMDQANDIYRVPLMVKFPGQTEGGVSDCAVTNLDVLPTIIETTGTTSSWKWAGESFASRCPTGRTRTVVSATGETAGFPGGFAEARARAAHYATVVTNAGDIRRVAAVGASAPMIGRPVTAAVVSEAVSSWTLSQKKMFSNVSADRGARVPSLVTGGITLTSPLEPGTEGIIAVDGIAAGVIGELSGSRDAVTYTAILDYSLLTGGRHTVELFLRSPDGTVTRVGPPA